jgi:hypothetical protein
LFVPDWPIINYWSRLAEKWRHPPKQTVFCSFDAGFCFFQKMGIFDKIFRFQKSVSPLEEISPKRKEKRRRLIDLESPTYLQSQF